MPYTADVYNGEDASKASIRKPSDLADDKPGTDVILVGYAHSPRGETVSQVDVSLHVGPIQKTIRVHGTRAWMPGSLGAIAPGPARTIREPVPLLYELAWGGLDLSDPEEPIGEPRNTVGRGVARDPRKLVGQEATQIEDPSQPAAKRARTPAGLGAIHRHWEPRARFAGTYDEAWMRDRMPLPPEDLDPRFHVTVPHDQWSQAPLRSDVPMKVTGATAEGTWQFQLPRIQPGFSSFVGMDRREHRTHLDTILIDAGERQVELTWRAVVPLPRKYEMLESVRIFEKIIV